MRKIIAVATLGLVFGVASAAGPQDQSIQGMGYVGLSFGGQKAAPHDFRYGLRFDQDAYYANSDVPVGAPFAKDRPALMQFEFNSRGLSAANVNGLSALKPSYRLQQNEGAPAADAAPAAGADQAAQPTEQAPPEEEGFFSRTWHKVTHFFGGGDDSKTDAKTDTASSEEKPAPAPEEDVVTDGTFMGFNAIDWGVLAVGAVGLGYIASDVNNGSESPDSYTTTGGGGTGGGGTSGGTTGGTTSVCVPTTPICVPYSTAGGNRWATSLEPEKLDPSYQKWLDGGTGQMGDLGG